MKTFVVIEKASTMRFVGSLLGSIEYCKATLSGEPMLPLKIARARPGTIKAQVIIEFMNGVVRPLREDQSYCVELKQLKKNGKE